MAAPGRSPSSTGSGSGSSGDPIGAASGLVAFLGGLGPRARQRAHPRLGAALAAAGAGLAVVGGLAIGFDDLAPARFDDDPNQLTGLLITAVLVATGYGILVAAREGPLATAGSTTAALAVPFLWIFATFEENDLPPFSIDAVLLLSVGAWLVSYVLGPTSGRPVFLGAGLVGLWLFLLEQIESVFSAPFLLFAPFTTPVEDLQGFDRSMNPGLGFDPPDLTTIGLISLLVGVGYLVSAYALDRRRLAGVTPPLLFAGVLISVNGVAALGDDLEGAGAGILLAVLGVAVASASARRGRRASTWIGAALVAIGLLSFLGDVLEGSSATAAGAATFVTGAALVAVAFLVARTTLEPGELEEGEAGPFFASLAAAQTRPPPPPPAPPPPPPAPPSA